MPAAIPPTVGHDDAFFWEGAAQGRLLLQRCADCHLLCHPPVPMCERCGSLAREHVEASGRGTVYSWIVSRHPTEPDAEARIVALVALAEGVRLVANLCDVDPGAVANDMPVEVVFRDLGGFVAPQFRPAGTGGSAQ